MALNEFLTPAMFQDKALRGSVKINKKEINVLGVIV